MSRARRETGRVLDRHLSRRALLKTGAVGLTAAALGGLPRRVFAAQPPAYPKGTTLHMLQWLNYVAAGDDVFLAQAAEFGKQMGVEVQIERIDQNSIPTRTTAAIEAQAGPDIILLQNNFPHLYPNSLADVSDVAEEIGKAQGGYYELPIANANSGGSWLAVPQMVFSWAMNYREDHLKQAGYDRFPDTWEGFLEMGRKLKAIGHPIGQAFGHSVNDPNNYVYPLLWSYGGKEVEKDGKTVVFDSKQSLGAVRMNDILWKEAFDPTGLSWDDSSNNRAFLAGSISVTGNAPSIYIEAKKKLPQIAQAMNHAPMPKGPAGRFYQLPTTQSAVMKYSKNQKLAKEFIRWFMSKDQYTPWFRAMDTFAIPPTKMWHDDPLWIKDPKTTVFRDVIKDSLWAGYAGPPSRQASEVLAKYLVLDTFVRSMTRRSSPEDALKWGVGQMKQIYGA